VRRNVSARLSASVAGASRLALQVAVAQPEQYSAVENIEITLDGAPIKWVEVLAPQGGRLWVIDAEPGQLRVTYEAALEGTAAPAETDVGTQLLYLRPSRYAESDRMIGLASGIFHDIDEPAKILAAVSSWVGTHLNYVSGSSGPTDGAVDSLLAGQGVCRDFAHLTVALLRAMQIPARLVAVYAPGLDPMDFHAVAEAFVAGAWYVVDATLLAPRQSLVRITTGRDASDTSFLSNYGGAVYLDELTVTATVDGDLPVEDVTALVPLS
jgi:transglutaminase-like putative cysteine protease